MADGQVVFEISADGTKAYATIQDITDALKEAGHEWENNAAESTGGIADKFTDMFKKIASAGAIAEAGKFLFDLGKEAIELASDLEEVQNVVDVTFGDGAAKIEQWASKAGEQFGLTEYQAKQFTSTLGAMMKSTGLAGDQIVDMSTDLAGLAADMASFYNLDFETAFQKIRAGISGETEPLKQLGINLSVANLNAFALQQGLGKTFDQMSSAEQTLLRYQYIMQATSDAQGDFARTSDGLANAQRRAETAITEIKSSLGESFYTVVADATSTLADFLEKLKPSKEETIFDQIDKIKIDKEAKITEIDLVAQHAQGLLLTLQEINTISGLNADSDTLKYIETLTSDIGGLGEKLNNNSDIAENIGNIAGGANALESVPVTDWGTLADNLAKLPIEALKNAGKAGGNVEGIADGANVLQASPASDWGTLADNLGKLPVTALNDADKAGGNVKGIAEGANTLKNGQPTLWSALSDTLSKISGLDTLFSDSAAGNFGNLVTALTTDAPSEDKAAAWETFLNALGSNAGALKSLTGKDAAGAAEWLGAMRDAVEDAKLNPNDVDTWTRLLAIFTQGLSDENKTTYGDSVIDELLAMGNESEYAREALAALGYESDDITKAQNRWISVCKELVQIIPGLSSIINTETGEVKGGTKAVQEYIEAWKADNIIQARIDALKQQKALFEQQALVDAANDVALKRIKAESMLRAQGFTEEEAKEYMARDYADKGLYDLVGDTAKKQGGIGGSLWDTVLGVGDWLGITPHISQNKTASKEAQAAVDDYVQSAQAALEIEKQLPYYTQAWDEEIAALQKETGKSSDELLGMADAAEESAEELSTLGKAASGDADAIKEVTDAVTGAAKALEDVANYQERIRSETEQTVRSVVTGFEKVETPMQKMLREEKDLKKAIEDAQAAGKDTTELWSRYNANQASQISVSSMTQGLQSQLDYMREYQKMLDDARAKGVSEDLLSTLSDGSQQSFDYLYAITHYEGDITELNTMYADVQKEAEKFTNTLTDSKLAADETYQSLVETAQQAVDALNLGDQAYESVSATVQGIIDAMGDKAGDVKTQVDRILAQVARLNNMAGFDGWNRTGFGAYFPDNSDNVIWRPTLGGRLGAVRGSHASGIDNVPFDGYLALLHQGERVQTAAEADLSRRYSYQQPAFDYSAMGGAIGSSIGRGNVYLDGKVVGNIISARQGNSYRALERSGWQG